MDVSNELNFKKKLGTGLTNFDLNIASSESRIIRFWKRLPIVVRAIIVGLLVCEIGIIAWLLIGTFIPVPLSIFAVLSLFVVYVKYFSGSWGPRETVEVRRTSFRLTKLPSKVWKWSLASVLMMVVLVQSGLVITFRLIDFPSNFTVFNLDGIPFWLAVLFIVFAAAHAGIFEEIGFRGYMQVPLEQRYGPKVAITIVSLMFVVLHLNQVWAPPVLFHLFALGTLWGILAYVSGSLIPSIIAHTVIDIFSFSFWWSGAAEEVKLPTIFETGIDSHFIVWTLIFVVSLALFFGSVRKIRTVRQQAPLL